MSASIPPEHLKACAGIFRAALLTRAPNWNQTPTSRRIYKYRAYVHTTEHSTVRKRINYCNVQQRGRASDA